MATIFSHYQLDYSLKRKKDEMKTKLFKDTEKLIRFIAFTTISSYAVFQVEVCNGTECFNHIFVQKEVMHVRGTLVAECKQIDKERKLLNAL